MTDRRRYAAYFAPAFESPWWAAGSHWLGRCAVRGIALEQPPVPGAVLAEQRRLTEAPRRYGWHATLKAPFALAPGADLAALRSRLRDLCRERQPFAMSPLRVALLGDFLALVPDGAGTAVGTAAIDAVARACVTGLHDLAEPPSPEEVQRRRSGGLTPEQDALLLRWGYPHVMQCFRFHLSLTGPLRDATPETVSALREAADRWFSPLPRCRFESVALFEQPRPDADFTLLEHVAFGAASGTPDPAAAPMP